MARRTKKEMQEKEDSQLLDECIDHQAQSAKMLETVSSTWDEKEAMLIGKLEDSLSKKAKSKIFDPRLSTIVFERASRVMAQNPKGKAMAVSSDDIGKNALMNLYLKHIVSKDNEQFSHLVKLRMLDLYSLVYGSMFGLVSWRVNMKNGYIGPSTYIIPIRDAFPQPGIRNVNDADWFNVRTWLSVDALKNVDGEVWKKDNIAALIEQLKKEKSEGDKPKDGKNDRSYVERTYYPSNTGDTVFPRIEVFTEYRGDKWITWTPQRTNSKTSKPFILRVLNDPYPEEMLPIVAKHCFPLIDSPISLGEFERGKTLQYAINSLINLYFDGVKYSIFPPLAINADKVVPSSIKWGAGERWFMENPNVDVQPVALSPRGIDTFNSTYGFLLSALYNQSGSSEVSPTGKTDSSLGKTPQAIRFQANKESARDNWDKMMIEETVREIYTRFIALATSKLESSVAIRLFGPEIEEIKKTNPDVVELFKSGRGQVKISKKAISGQYDFELETGSTMAPNLEGEREDITDILKSVLENGAIQQSLAVENQQVNVGELFRRWLTVKGIKDVDKIITAKMGEPSLAPNVAPQEAQGQVIPNVVPATEEPVTPPEEITPEAPAVELQDPDIRALAERMRGGINGIPPIK